MKWFNTIEIADGDSFHFFETTSFKVIVQGEFFNGFTTKKRLIGIFDTEAKARQYLNQRYNLGLEVDPVTHV